MLGDVFLSYQILELGPPTSSSEGHRQAKIARFSALQVRLLQGRGLLTRQLPGVTHAFCCASFGPEEGRTLPVEGAEPVWDWEAEFPLQRSRSTLLVSVWGLDAEQTPNFMGEARLDVGAADADAQEAWVPLGPRGRTQEDVELQGRHGAFGEVRVQWEYLTDEQTTALRQVEAERRKAKVACDTLNLDMVDARHLRVGPGAGRGGVLVALHAGGRTQHTRAVPLSASPVWAEYFEVPLQRHGRPLVVRVHAGDLDGPCLGQAELDLAAEPDVYGMRYFRLHGPLEGGAGGAPRHSSFDEYGEIFLRWRFVNKRQMDAVRAGLRERKQREFASLDVRVLRIRNLPPGPAGWDAGGRLLTKVMFGVQDSVTGGVADGPHPEWDHPVRFSLDEAPDAALWLRVLRQSTDGRLEEVGQATFDLAAEDTAGGAGWLLLQPPEGGYKLLNSNPVLGEIFIEWQYSVEKAQPVVSERDLNRGLKAARMTDLEVVVAGARGAAVPGEEVVAKLTWGDQTQQVEAEVSAERRESADVERRESADVERKESADAERRESESAEVERRESESAEVERKESAAFSRDPSAEERREHSTNFDRPDTARFSVADGAEDKQLRIAAHDSQGQLIGEAAVDVAGDSADTGEQWVALLPRGAGPNQVPFLERNVRVAEVLVRWRFAADERRSEDIRQQRSARRVRRLELFTHVRLKVTKAQGLPLPQPADAADTRARALVIQAGAECRTCTVQDDPADPVFADCCAVGFEPDPPDPVVFTVRDAWRDAAIGQAYLDVMGEELDTGWKWVLLGPHPEALPDPQAAPASYGMLHVGWDFVNTKAQKQEKSKAAHRRQWSCQVHNPTYLCCGGDGNTEARLSLLAGLVALAWPLLDLGTRRFASSVHQVGRGRI